MTKKNDGTRWADKEVEESTSVQKQKAIGWKPFGGPMMGWLAAL